MSTFWVVAGSLLLVVVAALAVPMLRRARGAPRGDVDSANIALYRDQLAELEVDRRQGTLSDDQFAQAKLELDRRLLSEIPATANGDQQSQGSTGRGEWRYVALAAVPIVTVLTYLVLGTPALLEGKIPSQQAGAAPAEHGQDLAQLVERLAARLKRNPDDAEAWVLLARSNQMLGRPEQALEAFAKATQLVPRSAQLWADYADVLVATSNGQWTPAAKDALAKSLALDALLPKALWLAGTEAFVRRDYQTALKYWEALAPLAEPGSSAAQTIAANIAEARTLAGGAKSADAGATTAVPAPSAARSTAVAPSAGADKSVSGVVTIAPTVAARVQANDTVFVFARAAQGPRMPLAIRRISVKELPYRFTLDDSSAMAPGMTISAFPQVVVGARVSKSGQAIPKPGDFEGLSPPVKPGTDSIQVTIDNEIR